MPRASRSNKVALAVIAAALLALVFLQTRGVQLASDFGQHRSQIHMLRPLVARARREPVVYEQALKDPAAFAGRPVVWCVDHLSKDVSYVDGQPAHPVAWVNEAGCPTPRAYHRRALRDVAAVVEGAQPSRCLCATWEPLVELGLNIVEIGRIKSLARRERRF